MPDEPSQASLDQSLDDSTAKTKQAIHQDPALAQSLAATPQMQDVVVDVEKDLLHEIVTRLDESRLTPEEAQSLAQKFLALLPIQDQQDLLAKLQTLTQATRGATQSVYLKYAAPYEEYDRHKKIKMMTEHLQKGNIEHAITVAQGGTPNV